MYFIIKFVKCFNDLGFIIWEHDTYYIILSFDTLLKKPKIDSKFGENNFLKFVVLSMLLRHTTQIILFDAIML